VISMLLLNFAHPLTADHMQQIEALLCQKIDRILCIPAKIDPGLPLGPQVVALADRAGLSPEEWQILPLLINPPALNFIAVALLAELHGRCGYFPAHLRMRPVQGSLPQQFELAEILDLQGMRDGARRGR
jgi:hypothetical protein